MKIKEIEDELISAISEIQNISEEEEIEIDKNTCPFNLPNFDSRRFCEALTASKFNEVNFNKVIQKLTEKSTINEIAKEVQNQINNEDTK